MRRRKPLYWVLGLALSLLPAAAFGQGATGVNPPVGSVWTYLGATYGAGWAVGPPGFGIAAESCGATGNGTTDDTRALAQCDANAIAARTSLVLTKQYRVASSLTLNAPEIFLPSASIEPDVGATVSIIGNVTAPDTAVIFTGAGSVVTINQPRVSIAWWGATPAAADAAPSFQKAVASINNKKVVCPPGVYTFNSVKPTYDYTIPSGANPASVWITAQSNFELDCEGADIRPGPNLESSAISVGGGGYGYTLFQIGGNSTDFYVHGFLFGGDYHSATLINAGFMMWGVQRFTMSHLDFNGNWGNQGNAFVGDFQANAVYSDIKMANMGICYDFAFLQNVVFDKIFAHGSDGASGAGLKCFSIIHDAVNASGNPTPVSITETVGVSVTNSDVSNFAHGDLYGPVVLTSGRSYRFHGNHWHDNPGSTGVYTTVVEVSYIASGSYSSVGHPAHDIVFAGDAFINNGATVGGRVIYMDSGAITNADRMGGLMISGCDFSGNSVGGAPSLIGSGNPSGLAYPGFGGSGNYYGGVASGNQLDNIVASQGLVPGYRESFSGNTGNYAAAGATVYTWVAGNNANADLVRGVSPFGGYARAFYMNSSTSPGAGQSYSAVFRVNGTGVVLGCTISGATGNACNDQTNFPGISAGANLDIQITSTAGAAPVILKWGMELDSYN